MKVLYSFWILLMLTTAVPAAPFILQPQGTYSLYEYDFDGDGRVDLAEVHRRHLNLYRTPEGQYEVETTPFASILIPREVALVGPAQLTTETTRADWLGLSRDGIWKLEREDGAFQFKLAVPISLQIPEHVPAPTLSRIAMDFNGDGIDEFITPRDGLALWRADANQFLPAAQIPGKAMTGYQYDQIPRQGTFMVSSRPDLPFSRSKRPATWNRGAIQLFASQWFGVPGDRYDIVDLNGDGLLDWAMNVPLIQREGLTFSPLKASESGYRNFRQYTFMKDLDKDGRPDGLAIETNRDLVNPQTDIYLSRGRFPESFPMRPDEHMVTGDYTLVPSRTPLVDFNGDGYLDIMLSELDFEPGSVQANLEAYCNKGLNLKLRVYLWDPKGGNDGKGFFEKRPTYNRRIRLAFEVFELVDEESDLPFIVDRDFTGDGLPDLILKERANVVGLFPQESGQLRFLTSAMKSHTLPHQVQSLYPRDIDGQAPDEVLCLSKPNQQGQRSVSVLHW